MTLWLRRMELRGGQVLVGYGNLTSYGYGGTEGPDELLIVFTKPTDRLHLAHSL